MAIAFSAASKDNGAGATSRTLNFAAGALTDGVILAGVGEQWHSITVSSITFNGTSFGTPDWDIEFTTFFGHAGGHLVSTGGTHDVVVTMSGAADFLKMDVIALQGVHQTTPIRNTPSADRVTMSAVTTQQITLTTVADDWVVDHWLPTGGAGSGGDFAVQAGQTERVRSDGGTHYSAISTKPATTTSTTVGWDVTFSNVSGSYTAWVVEPVGGGGGSGNPWHYYAQQ